MHHRCIIVMHIQLHGREFVKLMWLRESGGGGQRAYCAVYGEERNGEWESSVVIDGLTLEKTPDPVSFPAMDYTSLGLQLGDSGNKQIKKIPISHRTLLAF